MGWADRQRNAIGVRAVVICLATLLLVCTLTVTANGAEPSPEAGEGAPDLEFEVDWNKKTTVRLLTDATSDWTLIDVTQPLNGDVGFSGDGSVVYTPYANFTGVDSFTYTLVDAQERKASGWVMMFVMAETLIAPDSLGFGVVDAGEPPEPLQAPLPTAGDFKAVIPSWLGTVTDGSSNARYLIRLVLLIGAGMAFVLSKRQHTHSN